MAGRSKNHLRFRAQESRQLLKNENATSSQKPIFNIALCFQIIRWKKMIKFGAFILQNAVNCNHLPWKYAYISRLNLFSGAQGFKKLWKEFWIWKI